MLEANVPYPKYYVSQVSQSFLRQVSTKSEGGLAHCNLVLSQQTAKRVLQGVR